jgi:amino acid adenylation domain-containing protein
LDRVGIDNGFFNVGGDSIKAIRLVSAINDGLNSHLKILDLYTRGTIRQLAELVKEEESPGQRELYQKVSSQIETLKNKTMAQHAGMAPLVEDIYPMSDIEKGIMFYYLMHYGKGIYHDQFTYLLYYEDFDRERFERALALAVKKHPILRTGFNMEDFSEPVHLVYKNVTLPFTYGDISRLSRSRQHQHLENLLARDRDNPFDAAIPPLWRMSMFALGHSYLCLVFIFHHAILDGWSVASLMTELHKTYFQLKDNPNREPQPLKITYKDAVIGELVEKQNPRTLEYWKNELMGYKRLEFSATTKSKGELEPMKIFRCDAGPELVLQLQRLTAQYHTSVKNLCFGAYACFMNMFSYEDDIVVGCVTNNRPGHEDGDKILGCFLNTLPVRLKIPRGLTWKDYIRQVEEKMLEIKKYEGLSLYEISVAVGEAGKDRNPIFDTLFNFMDFHVYGELSSHVHERIPGQPSPRENTKTFGSYQDTNTLFDFEVNLTSGNLHLCPKYNISAIGEKTVERCCGYFLNILGKYIHDPGGTIRSDEIISREEKDQLLYRFNDTRTPYSDDKTMHQLFEEQVKRTPDRVALIETDGIGQLSYRELDEQSNQLAHGLKEKGIKPGGLAAVVMERSISMVIAVMGILKAGGAYVPIETYLPDLRIEKLLESLVMTCILTTPSTLQKVETIGRQLSCLDHIICLHPGGSGPGGNTRDNPLPAASPGDTAYVIFTSGSTGVPKGVVETHGPVVNVIRWVNKSFDVRYPDKLLFVASLGFDLSVYDIFGILAGGASLRVVSGQDIKDPEALLDIIMTEGITFWDSAPAALQQVVPFFHKVKHYSTRSQLRLVFLSGDWIPVTMPDALRETFAGVRVISLGGATEATIWSNYYPIEEVDPTWPSIPYGKPIQNARYYILDRNREICPIGVPGDLYIGGQCLASGYINDVEFTAKKFDQDLWDYPDYQDKKNRSHRSHRSYIYKTGDIARWFEDGNMQFLGRKDHQVKIRGFRVELGEIEAHLLNHEHTREVVVLLLDKDGHQHLCAYIVPSEGAPGDVSAEEKLSTPALRKYLSQHLPDYMIPSYFVLLEEIPLTPNGKVDRKALPGVDASSAASGTTYAAPHTRMEKAVARVWQEVLHREKVGIHDNFFDLGGTSLTLMELKIRLNKTLQIDIPVIEMFRYPTIKSLLGYLREEETVEDLTDREIDESLALISETTDVWDTLMNDPPDADDDVNEYGVPYEG